MTPAQAHRNKMLLFFIRLISLAVDIPLSVIQCK